MHAFSVERLIAAPPDAIWPVLTDSQRLANGDFGIVRINGTIALGQSITLWSAVAPKRAFPLKVTALTPNRSMIWRGGMPLGLFTGTRTFTLDLQEGGTMFRMREQYEGLVTGLIWPSMPDLTPSFRQFAAALAHAVEG